MKHKPKRCSFWIEKEWPGHSTCVLSRKQCKNTTFHSSGKCFWHRPFARQHRQELREVAAYLEGDL